VKELPENDDIGWIYFPSSISINEITQNFPAYHKSDSQNK